MAEPVDNNSRGKPKEASEPTTPAEESSFTERFKRATEQITEQVGDVIDTVKDKAADLRLDKHVERAKNVIKEIDIPQPLADAAKSSVHAVNDAIDQLTGSKLLELVREAQEKQARYNDVLATRLAEALDRLDRIEKHLGMGDHSGGVR